MPKLHSISRLIGIPIPLSEQVAVCIINFKLFWQPATQSCIQCNHQIIIIYRRDFNRTCDSSNQYWRFSHTSPCQKKIAK